MLLLYFYNFIRHINHLFHRQLNTQMRTERSCGTNFEIYLIIQSGLSRHTQQTATVASHYKAIAQITYIVYTWTTIETNTPKLHHGLRQN